jgi:hypothetical protein
MNFGTNPYDIAFIAWAPAMALMSLGIKRRRFVLLALAVAALAGWGLGFASENWVDNQWAALMERTQSPSPQLIEQFNSDGASKAAVLFLGFPISLIYASIWFVLARTGRYFTRKWAHA